jgi:hypothetical protein
MAVNRYDQRKNLEAAEANAINTEYVRVDLISGVDTARLRALIRSYLDQRILFYETRDDGQLRQIDVQTERLQADLWSIIQGLGKSQPNPMVAMAVSGMNDVLNAQGYTQAAWWNRIPTAAWGLMWAIAVCSNVLVGYGARRFKSEAILFLVLPLVLAISFFLIADIDSPRGGVIRVEPLALTYLAETLPP